MRRADLAIARRIDVRVGKPVGVGRVQRVGELTRLLLEGDGLPSALGGGLTQASIVMARRRSSDAEVGTVTESFVPLKRQRPAVHAGDALGALDLTVLPLPEESSATVPDVSSKPHAPTRPSVEAWAEAVSASVKQAAVNNAADARRRIRRSPPDAWAHAPEATVAQAIAGNIDTSWGRCCGERMGY